MKISKLVLVVLLLLAGNGMARAQDIGSADLQLLASNPTFAWSAGTWYLGVILLDDADNPVDTFYLDNTPLVVAVNDWPRALITMNSTASDGYKIRFYRKLGSPMSPGEMGIEYVEHNCAGGSVVCDASGPASFALNNGNFVVGGDVLPVELEHFSIE